MFVTVNSKTWSFVPSPLVMHNGETEAQRGEDICPSKAIPLVSTRVREKTQSPIYLKPGLREGIQRDVLMDCLERCLKGKVGAFGK